MLWRCIRVLFVQVEPFKGDCITAACLARVKSLMILCWHQWSTLIDQVPEDHIVQKSFKIDTTVNHTECTAYMDDYKSFNLHRNTVKYVTND